MAEQRTRSVDASSTWPVLRNHALDAATATALEGILSEPLHEHDGKQFGWLNGADAHGRAIEWRKRAQPEPHLKPDRAAEMQAKKYEGLTSALGSGWDAQCVADLEPQQIFHFAELFDISTENRR
jgi:hypothetical protein